MDTGEDEPPSREELRRRRLQAFAQATQQLPEPGAIAQAEPIMEEPENNVLRFRRRQHFANVLPALRGQTKRKSKQARLVNYEIGESKMSAIGNEEEEEPLPNEENRRSRRRRRKRRRTRRRASRRKFNT